MKIRIILISAALLLVVLLAWRISGIFMPYPWMLWVWWVLIAPYLLAGGILSIAIVLFTILSLGQIRYRIHASIASEKTAYVEVTYLMRLVHFVYAYRDGKQETLTRIAWMQIGDDKPQKKKRKTKAATSATHATHAQKIESTPQPTPAAEQVNKKIDTDANKENNKDIKKDRLGPLKQVKAVLTYPDRKIIMSLCIKCLQKFVKALKPKHIDITGVIGFEDPSTTGIVMGTYEAVVGTLGLRHKVQLLGNYLESALELNIETEGRTRLWRLWWPFLWLYLHKPIRVALRKII
ncbi:MAG: hypothetical protein FWC92_02835 [Defluviitaleaceae bacterium]|nr:hypothetical protein [Defluviitaleaceae bacterium]